MWRSASKAILEGADSRSSVCQVFLWAGQQILQHSLYHISLKALSLTVKVDIWKSKYCIHLFINFILLTSTKRFDILY